MNIRHLLLLTLLCTSFVHAQTNRVERVNLQKLLQEAEKAFRSGTREGYLDAAEKFKSVRELGDEETFNHNALSLAEGMAYLKAEKPQEALEALDTATHFEDLEETGRHRRFKGLAHMALAQGAANTQEWETALEEIDKAISSFQDSLQVWPESDASRHNLKEAERLKQYYTWRKPTPTPTPTPQPTPTPNPQASPTPTPTPEPDGEEEQEEQQEQEQQPGGTPTPDPDAEEEENAGSSEQEESESDEEQEGSESEPSDQEGDPSETSAAEMTEEEMNALEAERILEAYLEREKRQRRQILEQQRRLRSRPVEKDW